MVTYHNHLNPIVAAKQEEIEFIYKKIDDLEVSRPLYSLF